MGFITDLTAAIPNTGIYINGYPSGVDNDQGNIRAGGTIAETSLWTSSSLGEEERLVTISSGVNNTGVIAPSTASTFNNQPGQVIVKYTTDIAGVSDLTDAIRSAGSTGVFSINQRQVIRTLYYKTAVVAGNWNVFSGAFDPALSTAIAGGWSISDGNEQGGTLAADSTDRAANPTQSAPGQLTYMQGSPTPKTGVYSSRSIW